MNNIGHYQLSAVITAFNIGPILTDTIISILEQKDVCLGCIVVIVDGCDYTTSTRDICTRFSRAYPNKFNFIWLENGGVSRARNTGVKWIRENHSDTCGIFLIDGDDLIDKNLMCRCVTKIVDAQANDPSGKVGWTYSSQGQFGSDSPFVQYPEKFVSTRWFSNNLSQPSCLIDMSMFDAEVYWDEEMRKGIEDWEYWLTAIEAGFKGIYVEDTYLRYRRLTGNRSSLNRSNDAITKDYMREKHKNLFSVERFLREENELFPRWAFMNVGEDLTFDLSTDPLGPFKLASRERFESAVSKRISLANSDPYIIHPYFPDMIAFLDPRDADILNRSKSLHSTLLEIESSLQTNCICTLQISEGSEVGATARTSIIPKESATTEGWGKSNFSSFFVSVGKLIRCIETDNKKSNLEDLISKLLNTSHTHISLGSNGPWADGTVDAARDIHVCDFLHDLVRNCSRLVHLPKSVSHLQRDGHNLCAFHCANHNALGNEVLSVWPVLPQLPHEDTLSVAMICRDQDITRVLIALKHIEKITENNTIRINLAVVGKNFDLSRLSEEPLIKTIGYIESDISTHIPNESTGYFGLPKYEQLNESVRKKLTGMLAGSGLVIDFCGPKLASVIMELKSMGLTAALVVDDVCSAANSFPYTEMNSLDAVAETDVTIADERQFLDPIAAQAYVGAYNYLLVSEEINRVVLNSYGISSNKFIDNYSELLDYSGLLDVVTCEVSRPEAQGVE